MADKTIVVAVVAVAVLSAFTETEGAVKLWTPNVNFLDPANWDPRHVPSSVNVAVFQKDTAVPVVLPGAVFRVCQMVLPANGQLILEANSQIVFSSSSANATGCMGEIVTFKQNTPLEWINPDNWWSEKNTKATPHIERIPCEHDIVLFNPNNSFSVIVPDFPISVGAIQFGNQTFSQDDLNEFLLSDVGDRKLRGSSNDYDVSITLMSPTCSESTGCECGTQPLLDQVCKTMSKSCADKLGCISPVKPIGHCCRICGAYFLLSYDDKFFKENFNKHFEKDMAKIKSNYKKIQLFIHTSKISSKKIQIVLVSGTEYVDAVDEIAKAIHVLLIEYTKSSIGINDVELFSSGLSYDVDGMTFGQMALTTCITIIFCMVTIMVYYTKDWKSLLSSSRSGGGAVFVKFENETNDVELINEDVHLQRRYSFDNPTYGAVQDNLNHSMTFSEDLSNSIVVQNDVLDVELKETNKQK